MTDDVLSRLAPSNRVLKRAQYEAFAFSLLDGDILVRNESHAEPSKHEYRVTIEDGVPTTCTCPADARFSGACKHRVAVAIRTPLLEVAEEMQLLADGGARPERRSAPEPRDSPTETDCACQDLPRDLPCWACYRSGRRALPE